MIQNNVTSNPIANIGLIDRGYFTVLPLITEQKIRNILYEFSHTHTHTDTHTQSGPITFYSMLQFCNDNGQRYQDSPVTIVISVISIKVKLSFNKTKRSSFGGVKLTIKRLLRSKKRNFLRDMCFKRICFYTCVVA